MTKAVLLSRATDGDKAKAEIAKRPGRFVWFAATDPSQPGAIDLLRKSAENGACGFGELKNHIAADSPEMLRVYDLAAEMGVPVLVHFQEIPHFEGEGVFNTGYQHFDKVLKAHPRTTFIGHADYFWANISADVPTDVGYPTGPVKPGGLTDKWLSDYPNLYADMSANSCNNALGRDPDFSRGFIDRHQTKLLFGSDCNCTDGHGAGVNVQANSRLKGKCVARATLELAAASPLPKSFVRSPGIMAHGCLRSSREGIGNDPIESERQGRAVRRRSGHAAAVVSARSAATHRHQVRLWRWASAERAPCIVNGEAARSCLTPMKAVAGKSITTIEGLAPQRRSSAAEGVEDGERPAVRLLPERADHAGGGHAEEETEAHDQRHR